MPKGILTSNMMKICVRPARAWHACSQVRLPRKATSGQAGIISARLAKASIVGSLSIVVIAAALIAIFCTRAIAQLVTESCVDCHVVHAWEDETETEKASARAKAKAYASAIKVSGKVYASALEEACEGCHAHANSHTLVGDGRNTVPIVKSGQEPDVPLAGGNFYYPSGQSHLQKAGGSCTSCHRDVKHHATSYGYRFLGPDIEGIGDPLYEHGQGHNIYKSGDQYCSACHANFCGSNNQKAGRAWIRHPTNTPLPMDGEYGNYVYRKDVPVSYPDPNNPDRSSARVMCISCHRPHGTSYPYLLRWDYNDIVANGGSNDNGCFACHSQKDLGYQHATANQRLGPVK